MLYLLLQVILGACALSLLVFIHIVSHFVLCRFYIFFSDSGMCSSKVCIAQVANGSDYKIGYFDMLSNTRLEFQRYTSSC